MEGLDLSSLFNEDSVINGGRFEETVEAELLPAAHTMSLEAVKPQLMEVVQAVDQMVRDAKEVKVDNQQAAQFAVALGGQAKQIAKILKAKEVEVTQKASDYIKTVNGFCSMFYDQLIANTKKSNTESIELILKKKIGDYQAFVELERQKQGQAARKAQQELQARLDREAEEANRKAREEAAARAKAEAEAKALSEAETKAAMAKAEAEAKAHEVVAPVVPDIVMTKTEGVTRSETGAAAFTKKPWKAEITNPDEVDRVYCSPDMKKINEAVKAGVREMKGVRIYQDQQVNFRS